MGSSRCSHSQPCHCSQPRPASTQGSELEVASRARSLWVCGPGRLFYVGFPDGSEDESTYWIMFHGWADQRQPTGCMSLGGAGDGEQGGDLLPLDPRVRETVRNLHRGELLHAATSVAEQPIDCERLLPGSSPGIFEARCLAEPGETHRVCVGEKPLTSEELLVENAL